MMKTMIMDAIKRHAKLTGPGTVLDPSISTSIVGVQSNSTSTAENTDDEVYLPTIQCIVGTKSAQDGIIGLWLKYGKNKGLSASPYE